MKLDGKDPESFYYLGHICELSSNIYEAVIYYTQSLTLLNLDEGYIINDYFNENKEKVSLAKIHIKRGGVFRQLEMNILMCEDYQKACELGDCEAHNKHCH